MCRRVYVCVCMGVCARSPMCQGEDIRAFVSTLFCIADLNMSELQVAESLVPSIRSIPANGSTKSTYIRFLTGLKAYSQIFSVKWKT